ncbi:MAG: hypothetical protein HY996_03840 [Micrococcales bacterium]|nr:hypothetical protein [Micrococcales bacterium]
MTTSDATRMVNNVDGVLPDDWVVVRFGPFTSAALERSAIRSYKRDVEDGRVPALYCVSVFAIERFPDEAVDDAVARLCLALRDDLDAPNGDKIAVTDGRTLSDGGFLATVDEPPRHHYVVGSPVDLTLMPDVAALEGVFSDRRKNPYPRML